MAHPRQKELQRELNARIPRGPRGSRQNELRARFWFWRVQGRSFDDSLAQAVEGVRETYPDFQPRLLSPSESPRA